MVKMNPEKFEEQLKKYKVIRSADYYKPRHVRSKQVRQMRLDIVMREW